MSARHLKGLIKWGASRFGVDVRSARHTEAAILRSLLRRSHPVAVLDVGANVGQYVRRVRAAGYTGTVVSFEMLTDAHRRLTEAAARDPHWIVAPRAALGSTSGTVSLHIAADSVSSSVLPQTSLLQAAAPRVTCIGQQDVPAARLDEFTDLLPGGELFLKVDTQGYEVEVLRGATRLMPRIVAMQLELSLVPLYEGAPSMADVLMYTQTHGYELFHLVPGLLDERDGRLLQADGFFVQSAFTASNVARLP
jgi:FkbM family methyltransferase